MFSHLPLPEKPPTSAEEAVATARDLLEAAGITGATVTLEKNAAVEGELAGAELKVSLPVQALETALHGAAVAAAAAQGVKVSRTGLTLTENEPAGLHLRLEVEAKVFGGTLTIQVEGNATPEAGTHLRFHGLKMDGGGGMFGGIASAMIRPKLAALEAAPLDLQRLAGVPVTLTQLTCADGALTLRGTFSSTLPPAL